MDKRSVARGSAETLRGRPPKAARAQPFVAPDDEAFEATKSAVLR